MARRSIINYGPWQEHATCSGQDLADSTLRGVQEAPQDCNACDLNQFDWLDCEPLRLQFDMAESGCPGLFEGGQVREWHVDRRRNGTHESGTMLPAIVWLLPGPQAWPEAGHRVQCDRVIKGMCERMG